MPDIVENKSEANASSFLRAARAGNLEKVLEFVKGLAGHGPIDINISNANGLNALHLASKEGHVHVVDELLKRGANVNAATKKGNTALHIASLAGQYPIVELLVQSGANVNAQSQNGFTPLYMAAQENHDRVVKYLVDHGSNQTITTEDGFTPLAVALQQGHNKVVSVLLENDSRSGKVRLPALHVAAKKDDCKAADLLLQSEANPDVTSKSGFTPLHIAAHYGNEAIAQILINHGSNVNFKARHDITPLHVAARWGKVNMVSILLNNGAIIDAKTRDGLTPLHCAARSGHADVVQILITRGADISSKTKNELTPLHMAAQGDHVDCARILLDHDAPVDDVTVDYLTSLHICAHYGNVDTAVLLLDRKAEVDARALNGFTPLHIACKKNRIKVIELLLKRGASISCTTESGLTPLHVASFMGHMNIVIYLLKHGADTDAPTVRGETPLHLAARANQTDIMRILLRNGAKVDARARENQTSLHVAARLGNTDTVVLLLQHGAVVDAKTTDDYTPVHLAAKEGHAEALAALLDHASPAQLPALLTCLSTKGFSPLHLAAKCGSVDVTKVLLERNTPVDVLGKNDVTPLHVATHYDHPAVANLLLEKGASVHAKATNGYTPLHIAAKKNQMDVAPLLLDHGSDPNAPSRSGFTPVHLAAQGGFEDMTSLLVDLKGDPKAVSNNGLTPLHLAAQNDHVPVASILVKHGADVNAMTIGGYTPLHTACHFGRINMVRFLLDHGADVGAITSSGYTPLHQAAQQGHSAVISLLLQNKASPETLTNQGQTALSIAQKLGYVSVIETLKVVTETIVTTTTTTTVEEKYKVLAPETMQETLMSDSDEDDGDLEKSFKTEYLPPYLSRFEGTLKDVSGDDTLLGDHSYRYLTSEQMKSLGDDSVRMLDQDPSARLSIMERSQGKSDYSPDYDKYQEDIISPTQLIKREEARGREAFVDHPGVTKVDNVPSHKPPVQIGFLVSFMVDARGGAMRGCRHSGIRVIVPPRKAPGPLRVTCRFVKKEKMANPPPLMEGEGLACRVLELGPAGTKFLGPVIIEIPHFASLRGNEREITILRSDNGENWREHVLEASETAVQEVLNESFDGEDALDDLHTTRITRILTNDFPLYFAIVTRIHQETHTIGPEGGIISSTIVPMVQAMFPEGALTKRIRIGLQAHPISPDMVSKMLGNRVAVSPVVTIEPRRRKFHKPITLTIPLPQASTKGMINQYNNGGDAPTLRLLCSITGGTTPAQWEDITGSTPLTFVNDYVSFTTTVSARFWLMDCRQVSEATKFATEVYREATHVPYMARMLVYAKRRDANEALLRAFTVTDDKMEKTLEEQEHFTEVAQSRDVEVLDNKLLYVEMVGNLIPVTKTDHRHLVETEHPSNGHNGHQNHVSATPTQNVASSPSTHALATNGHHEPHEPSNQYENMLTTTSASYLATKFRPFQENRLPFRVRIKDPEQEPMGRLMFLREPHRSGANVRSSIGSSSGTDLLPPICTLNIVLPDQIITDSMETEVRNPWTKSFLHELGIGRDVILNPDLMADKISRHVQGDWIRLAHELNFPQHEIEDIQTEFPQNPGHQAKAMIVAWKRKTEHLPENESRVTLERALRSINRDDVVQSCGLGSERPKANGAIPSSPVIRDQKKGTGLDQLDKSLDDSLDRYGYEEYKEGGHSRSTDHPSHPASSFHDGFHAQEEHLSSSPEEAPKKEESPVTPVVVKPKVPPPPTSEKSHPEKIALLQKMVADTVDDHNVPPIRPPRKGEQGLDGVEKPIVSETTIVSQDKKTKGQIPTQEFVVESEEPKTPRSSPEPRKTDLTFPTVASPSEGVKGLSDEIQSRLQIHSDKTESESDQQDPDSFKPPPTTTTVLKSSHFRAATPSDNDVRFISRDSPQSKLISVADIETKHVTAELRTHHKMSAITTDLESVEIGDGDEPGYASRSVKEKIKEIEERAASSTGRESYPSSTVRPLRVGHAHTTQTSVDGSDGSARLSYQGTAGRELVPDPAGSMSKSGPGDVFYNAGKGESRLYDHQLSSDPSSESGHGEGFDSRQGGVLDSVEIDTLGETGDEWVIVEHDSDADSQSSVETEKGVKSSTSESTESHANGEMEIAGEGRVVMPQKSSLSTDKGSKVEDKSTSFFHQTTTKIYHTLFGHEEHRVEESITNTKDPINDPIPKLKDTIAEPAISSPGSGSQSSGDIYQSPRYSLTKSAESDLEKLKGSATLAQVDSEPRVTKITSESLGIGSTITGASPNKVLSSHRIDAESFGPPTQALSQLDIIRGPPTPDEMGENDLNSSGSENERIIRYEKEVVIKRMTPTGEIYVDRRRITPTEAELERTAEHYHVQLVTGEPDFGDARGRVSQGSRPGSVTPGSRPLSAASGMAYYRRVGDMEDSSSQLGKLTPPLSPSVAAPRTMTSANQMTTEIEEHTSRQTISHSFGDKDRDFESESGRRVYSPATPPDSEFKFTSVKDPDGVISGGHHLGNQSLKLETALPATVSLVDYRDPSEHEYEEEEPLSPVLSKYRHKLDLLMSDPFPRDLSNQLATESCDVVDFVTADKTEQTTLQDRLNGQIYWSLDRVLRAVPFKFKRHFLEPIDGGVATAADAEFVDTVLLDRGFVEELAEEIKYFVIGNYQIKFREGIGSRIINERELVKLVGRRGSLEPMTTSTNLDPIYATIEKSLGFGIVDIFEERAIEVLQMLETGDRSSPIGKAQDGIGSNDDDNDLAMDYYPPSNAKQGFSDTIHSKTTSTIVQPDESRLGSVMDNQLEDAKSPITLPRLEPLPPQPQLFAPAFFSEPYHPDKSVPPSHHETLIASEKTSFTTKEYVSSASVVDYHRAIAPPSLSSSVREEIAHKIPKVSPQKFTGEHGNYEQYSLKIFTKDEHPPFAQPLLEANPPQPLIFGPAFFTIPDPLEEVLTPKVAPLSDQAPSLLSQEYQSKYRPLSDVTFSDDDILSHSPPHAIDLEAYPPQPLNFGLAFFESVLSLAPVSTVSTPDSKGAEGIVVGASSYKDDYVETESLGRVVQSLSKEALDRAMDNLDISVSPSPVTSPSAPQVVSEKTVTFKRASLLESLEQMTTTSKLYSSGPRHDTEPHYRYDPDDGDDSLDEWERVGGSYRDNTPDPLKPVTPMGSVSPFDDFGGMPVGRIGFNVLGSPSTLDKSPPPLLPDDKELLEKGFVSSFEDYGNRESPSIGAATSPAHSQNYRQPLLDTPDVPDLIVDAKSRGFTPAGKITNYPTPPRHPNLEGYSEAGSGREGSASSSNDSPTRPTNDQTGPQIEKYGRYLSGIAMTRALQTLDYSPDDETKARYLTQSALNTPTTSVSRDYHFPSPLSSPTTEVGSLGDRLPGDVIALKLPVTNDVTTDYEVNDDVTVARNKTSSPSEGAYETADDSSRTTRGDYASAIGSQASSSFYTCLSGHVSRDALSSNATPARLSPTLDSNPCGPRIADTTGSLVNSRLPGAGFIPINTVNGLGHDSNIFIPGYGTILAPISIGHRTEDEETSSALDNYYSNEEGGESLAEDESTTIGEGSLDIMSSWEEESSSGSDRRNYRNDNLHNQNTLLRSNQRPLSPVPPLFMKGAGEIDREATPVSYSPKDVTKSKGSDEVVPASLLSTPTNIAIPLASSVQVTTTKWIPKPLDSPSTASLKSVATLSSGNGEDLSLKRFEQLESLIMAEEGAQAVLQSLGTRDREICRSDESKLENEEDVSGDIGPDRLTSSSDSEFVWVSKPSDPHTNEFGEEIFRPTSTVSLDAIIESTSKKVEAFVSQYDFLTTEQFLDSENGGTNGGSVGASSSPKGDSDFKILIKGSSNGSFHKRVKSDIQKPVGDRDKLSSSQTANKITFSSPQRPSIFPSPKSSRPTRYKKMSPHRTSAKFSSAPRSALSPSPKVARKMVARLNAPKPTPLDTNDITTLTKKSNRSSLTSKRQRVHPDESSSESHVSEGTLGRSREKFSMSTKKYSASNYAPVKKTLVAFSTTAATHSISTASTVDASSYKRPSTGKGDEGSSNERGGKSGRKDKAPVIKSSSKIPLYAQSQHVIAPVSGVETKKRGGQKVLVVAPAVDSDKRLPWTYGPPDPSHDEPSIFNQEPYAPVTRIFTGHDLPVRHRKARVQPPPFDVASESPLGDVAPLSSNESHPKTSGTKETEQQQHSGDPFYLNDRHFLGPSPPPVLHRIITLSPVSDGAAISSRSPLEASYPSRHSISSHLHASEDQYETEYEREGESVLKRLKIIKSVKTRTIVRDGKEETETFEETLYDDGRGHPVPFEDLDPELREKVSQFLLAESPSDPGAREIKGNE